MYTYNSKKSEAWNVGFAYGNGQSTEIKTCPYSTLEECTDYFEGLNAGFTFYFKDTSFSGTKTLEWYEGRKAGKNHKKLFSDKTRESLVPYPSCTDKYFDWMEGYCFGVEEIFAPLM